MYIVTDKFNSIIGAYMTQESAEQIIMRWFSCIMHKQCFTHLTYAWREIDAEHSFVGLENIKECTFIDIEDGEMDDVRIYRIYKTIA